MPKRIQRKRTKGWRMPENCVYVGRPTVFGNPFSAADSAAVNVANFRAWVAKHKFKFVHESQRHELLKQLESLRGKDLACWCSLDKPCHADVLLELSAR